MTTTECQHCHRARNLPPGITLCTHCWERLEAALIDIPDLTQQLLTTLARQDRVTKPGQSGGGGLKAASTPPSNGAVRDPAEILTHTLRAWADTLDAEHGPTGAVGYSRRIHAHLDHIRSRPDAGDITDEILHAYRGAQRIVDLPPDRIIMGECGTTDDETGEQCPGTMRGYHGKPEVRCDTCGHTENAEDRKAIAMANAWEEKAPLSVVVKAMNTWGLRVNHNTAKQWVKRELLRTPWQAPDGTALYTIAQVVEVMRLQQEKAEKKRRRKVSA